MGRGPRAGAGKQAIAALASWQGLPAPTPEGDIYIVDSPDNTRYLYTRSEREDGFLLHFEDEGAEPRHFYFEDEGRVTPDFYLYIPDYLQAEEANIYQLIGQYKPAGRTYEIIFYPYE